MTRSNPPKHRRDTEGQWKRRAVVTTSALSLTSGLVVAAPAAFATTHSSGTATRTSGATNAQLTGYLGRHVAAGDTSTSNTTTSTPATSTSTAASPSSSGATTDTGSTTAASGSWTSGAYLGGLADAKAAADFGNWRGSPLGAVMTFPVHSSWSEMANSQWNISTFNGFNGKLVVSVPMLPLSGGSLQDVASGAHDDVYRKMAQDLVDNNRGDAILRIGWEANGKWFPWGADSSSAADYKAAFRHVASVMKSVAPGVKIDFTITCGSKLDGSSDRLASLNDLYPGDDAVDIVGCDSYDMWSVGATNEEQWASSLAPADGPGMSDVVTFAVNRGKQWSVPEWGLVSQGEHQGNGDNQFYMRKMNEFFAMHSGNLAYEAYFDAKGLTDSELKQYPQAAAQYKEAH